MEKKVESAGDKGIILDYEEHLWRSLYQPLF